MTELGATKGATGGQPPKVDLNKMEVSPEIKNILQANGHPQFNNLAELQGYMQQLQQENPGRYNELFDAMHPGMRQQNDALEAYLKAPKGPIENIGR